MTLHTTWMSTLKFFLTRTTTRRNRLSTLHGRVKLRDIARTVDWLDRDPLARLAIAHMTQVCALVFTATEGFVADDGAAVDTVWVTGPAEF